jgi:enhancing lycopene biosynthesis protein 2
MKNFAVILSGSGFLDGAEIRESVLTLLALDQYQGQFQYQIFAPNKNQYHVVNHLNGEVTEETRNTLVEAARIARGKILDINQLSAEHFDGLIIPGGFGVAKNLSTFAFEGAACDIDPEMTRVIRSFYEREKPIGAICIAPAVVGKVLAEFGPVLTLGETSDASAQLEKWGVTHQETKPDEICVDTKNRIVSTPAYMYDRINLVQAQKGIAQLVDRVVHWNN